MFRASEIQCGVINLVWIKCPRLVRPGFEDEPVNPLEYLRGGSLEFNYPLGIEFIRLLKGGLDRLALLSSPNIIPPIFSSLSQGFFCFRKLLDIKPVFEILPNEDFQILRQAFILSGFD